MLIRRKKTLANCNVTSLPLTGDAGDSFQKHQTSPQRKSGYAQEQDWVSCYYRNNNILEQAYQYKPVICLVVGPIARAAVIDDL